MYLEGFVLSCFKNIFFLVIFLNIYYKYFLMKFKCFIEINIIGLIFLVFNLYNNNFIYFICLLVE